jgi:aminoglycoside phosphotransferase (APT) family kinase protein
VPVSRSIPATLDEITPQWISEAASAAGHPQQARSVEVVDAHSGTTGRARLRVHWEPPSQLPAAIFVKLRPSDPTSQAMVVETGMGRREASFYARLAAEVPVRVPTPLFADWSDDGASYVMLLEDLADAGCSFPSSGASETLSYAESLVSGLARLHARYWNSPRWQSDLEWVERPMRNDWGRVLMQMGMDQFRDQMPAHWVSLVDLYLQDGDRYSDLLEAGEQTLIHGDSHLGNLFVDAGEIGWLDWACFSRAPGMRDVAYFLTNSLDTDFRRASERALLERYRVGLLEAGGPERSPNEVWEDYRRFAGYSFVSAVTTAAAGSRMQSVEVGQRAMARMNEATADLSTLEVFREGFSRRA